MTYYDRSGHPSEVPHVRSRVRVPGRDEAGVVVDAGKDLNGLYCVGVHFASTGEVAYYDRSRVVPAPE